MGRFLYFFAILVTLSLSAPGLAELYQWTDARGVVHFSDEKPRGSGSQRLIISRELPKAAVIQTRASGSFRYQDSSEPAVRGRFGKGSSGKGANDTHACAEVKVGLEKVQAQLRSGYREPQGNRLREKRRALRTRYAYECR